MPGSNNNKGPILIGLAYIVLVVFIMIFCARESSGFDEFSKYWGLFGTLIGVATGAVPSFFFKAQADNAKQQADNAHQEASKATEKADLFKREVDPVVVQRLQVENPHLF